MLEIKTFFGDWRKVTKKEAENFYEVFIENASAIISYQRHDYFNKHHIKGGHVLMTGKVETDEEKSDRIFQHYKNYLIKLCISTTGRLRFNAIEYVCSFPKINPYEMAVNLIREGCEVIYDDTSISVNENEAKERKIIKLLVKEVD